MLTNPATLCSTVTTLPVFLVQQIVSSIFLVEFSQRATISQLGSSYQERIHTQFLNLEIVHFLRPIKSTILVF